MATPWQKQKNVLIDLEDIDPTMIYAITYNPCDKYQHFKDGQRLTKCINDLKQHLLYSLSVYEYDVYPELSKNGRFHVHGYIIIKDPIQWCLHHVHHLTNRGTLVIKPVSDKVDWDKYILKQAAFHRHVENQTFNKLPLQNHRSM